MTEETALRATPSRSRWSTALVSAFGGPFGGFLWIGSGRLAAASLVIISGIAFAIIYIGFPVLPGVDLTWAANLSGLGLMILWVALVVPFAHRFRPDRWYAHGFWVLLLVFLISYPAAFAIRAFLFQPFSMPSGSMEPTLVAGDDFFVSKSAYGYGRYSVPFGLLPVEGRALGKEPERGDVIVFRPVNQPDIDFVKRIVGLPGETIQMRDGVLYIDDAPVKVEDAGSYSHNGRQVKLQRETLPNGASYAIIDLTENSVGDNTPPFLVPSGQYFVLGDNRDNSSDSRFQVGMALYDNLVGRAERLYWNSEGTQYRSRQVLRPSHDGN